MPDIYGGSPMNLPVGITTVTVNGQLLSSDGSACVGAIEFTPSVAVAYTGSDVTLLPKTVSITLDDQGKFTYVGPATDDPAGNPGGPRTCFISEKMLGGRNRNVLLPMLPATKDYADLIGLPGELEGVPTTPVVTYITITTAQGGTP